MSHTQMFVVLLMTMKMVQPLNIVRILCRRATPGPPDGMLDDLIRFYPE